MNFYHRTEDIKSGMRIKGAIFDLDGTLLDSMGTWSRLSAEFLRERGKEFTDEFLERLRPVSLRDAAQLMIDTYGVTESVEEIVELFLSRVGYYFDHVFELKRGAGEFVRSLRARGVPCCVATAAERVHTENALRRLGLLDAFDFVLTTAEVGKSKFEPDIFLRAAEKLGISAADCFVFEDSLYAMTTAKKAGFGVAAIHEPEAAGNIDAIRAVCDVFLTSFEDAPRIFFT